jgi:hypothetical protein
MAVSIMLTSCGKLTGLLNGNKKADIKSKESPEQVLNDNEQVSDSEKEAKLNERELKALPSNYVHPAVKYFKAIGLRLLCLGLLYAVSEDGAKIVACLYLLYFGVSFMAYLVLELASTMPSIMSL